MFLESYRVGGKAPDLISVEGLLEDVRRREASVDDDEQSYGAQRDHSDVPERDK